LVRVAFSITGLVGLVCFTPPTSVARRRVKERVGFRYERDGQFMGIGQIGRSEEIATLVSDVPRLPW